MMGMISASGRFMARMVLAASQPFIRGIIISIWITPKQLTGD